MQWGSKSALGRSIFLRSIWVLMAPHILHSVGRFLRFPVDRRRRWGRLRLNPYCYERLCPHQEFQKSRFHATAPDNQIILTVTQRFWRRLAGFVLFCSLSVLRLSAGEWIKWKRSEHGGTSFHDLLQKQDIHQLLVIDRSLSDPSAAVGAQCLRLAGKKLLCYCAHWHGQLSVCVLWLQQLSCFQAIFSIIATVALLIIPSKLQPLTLRVSISVFKSCEKWTFIPWLWIIFHSIHIFSDTFTYFHFVWPLLALVMSLFVVVCLFCLWLVVVFPC